MADDNSLIVVRMHEADVVVRNYARDINNFRENAKADIKNIKNNISNMGLHWKGEIYDAFKKKMDSQVAQMQSCINGLDDLSDRLEVISKKFSEAIATMKKSTGE